MADNGPKTFLMFEHSGLVVELRAYAQACHGLTFLCYFLMADTISMLKEDPTRQPLQLSTAVVEPL